MNFNQMKIPSACKLNFDHVNSPKDAKLESFQQALAKELSKQGLEHSIPLVCNLNFDLQELHQFNLKDSSKFSGLTEADKEKIVKIVTEIKEDEEINLQMFHDIDQEVQDSTPENKVCDDEVKDNFEEDRMNNMINFNLDQILDKNAEDNRN